MVQNVMHLASMKPSSPQSLAMDVERDANQEPMLSQPPQGNTAGLEYLTNLTVPEAPNLLLNQVQGQDTMQLFDFNLSTPMDAANGKEVVMSSSCCANFEIAMLAGRTSAA